MAKIDFAGLDQVLGNVAALAESVNADTAERMLSAGAAVMADAQQASIQQCGLIDTGDMYRSVGHTKMKSDGSGAYFTDVFPQGKDRKGVRNAEKFFIAEYGKSNQPGTRVMTIATEKGAEPANAAMYDAWEAITNGK